MLNTKYFPRCCGVVKVRWVQMNIHSENTQIVNVASRAIANARLTALMSLMEEPQKDNRRNDDSEGREMTTPGLHVVLCLFTPHFAWSFHIAANYQYAYSERAIDINSIKLIRWQSRCVSQDCILSQRLELIYGPMPTDNSPSSTSGEGGGEKSSTSNDRSVSYLHHSSRSPF